MKKVFITFTFSLLLLNCGAQSPDSTIEIRLKLMQQTDGNLVKGLALSVSIINHSDQNIYIPNFPLLAEYSGIHFYQNEKDVWREIDIMKHEYYQSDTKPKTRIYNGIKIHIDDDTPVFFSDKDISKYFKQTVNQQYDFQSNIHKAYFEKANQHIDYCFGSEPLFLKARQELNNFMVTDIDYLLSKEFDYKISFNSEARDTLSHFRDSIMNYKPYRAFPDHIFEYKRYIPRIIISNTIYYTTLEMDLKNKNNDKNQQHAQNPPQK